MLRLALLLSIAAAAPPAPPAFAPVLARHGLDAEKLALLGWTFRGDRAILEGKENETAGPDELEAWLILREKRTDRAERKPVSLPRLDLAVDRAPSSLGSFYDGLKPAADLRLDVQAAPQTAAKPPAGPDWSRLAADLRDAKRRAAALRKLASFFKEDEDSPTGLSSGAPDALRVLAAAIHEGAGGPQAAVELRRELALVADLPPEDKPAFAKALTDPLTVYVALGRSHAPHALDSRLYFARMLELLGARGLTDFIDEADPERKFAANFLLRAHAYDVLIPYLNRRPAEAAAIVPMLFPDDAPGQIKGRAAQLEGLMIQLNAKGRGSTALQRFVEALESQAEAGGGAARQVAAYLKINEALLPGKYDAGIDALDSLLPPGLLEDAGLVAEAPYAYWPADLWRFVLHFANPDAYAAWRGRFLARGYALDSTHGVALTKTFGSLKIVLEAKLYAGNDESFLNGAEAQRYLSDVSRELRDPQIQGVILRNHAQFRIANLFGKGVNPHKLLLDGACRSAWDLKTLRGLCPTCYFVVNTGTGIGKINNDAVIAVVEGLALKREWDEIGEEWSKQSPGSSARMQGPWTPDFAQALKELNAHR